MKHEDSPCPFESYGIPHDTACCCEALVGKDDQVVVLSSIEEIPKFCDIIQALRVAWDMSFGYMVAMLLDHERRYTDTPLYQAWSSSRMSVDL